MPVYSYYMAVFQSTLVQAANIKIVKDDVVIDFFSGPREYSIPRPVSVILPEGINIPFPPSPPGSLRLPAGRQFIAIIARTDQAIEEVERICGGIIDRTIAILSIVYKSEIFSHLAYRGPLLVKDGRLDTHLWLKLVAPVSVKKTEVAEKFPLIIDRINLSNMEERFKLMSRFYTRAITEPPGEAKFLWLWTIIEIYPMEGRRDVRYLRDYLAQLLNREPPYVKEKLSLGRLCGLRGELVHKGKLDLFYPELGIIIYKLEEIVQEILRNVCGLPYSGALDKYLV